MIRRTAAVLACAIPLLAGCRGRAREHTYRDAPVILISIDTLRADHLPMFGYRDVETPNLDALRKDGVLFTSAFSQVPLTLPSHVSIFTGLLPPDNGVRNNIGYRLDARTPTIASMLHASGYATGAAISAYVLRGSSGLKDTFDFYDDAIQNKPGIAIGTLQRPGSATEEVAVKWIDEQKKPFLFFFHLFEPHSPYTPPEPYRSRFRLPYDGEIATADAVVGDFIAHLKERGIYDRAIIIFFSDHGEGLYQHGEPEHGIFLYREAIHVPLVVKLPNQDRAGDRVDDPVGLVDILPTIAQLTGAKPPAKLDGVSLFTRKGEARRLYSETLYPRIHLGWSELRSLEDAQYEFIQAPKPELYDMRADPAETRNVLTDQRRVYASMHDELARYGESIALPTQIDPEEAKKLTALGYLSATSKPAQGPLPDPKDRIREIAAMMAAMELSREGHDPQAIEAFRLILKENPNFSDAWNQLAQTLERDGRLEEAADAYRKTIELSPELAPEFGLSLGSVLLKLGKFDEAAAHARLGEKVNPGGAHMLLARIALGRGDLAGAEREARLAQSEPYSRIAAAVILAQILSQENRAAEGLAVADGALQQAAAENAGPVESLQYARADALARLERYPEAVEAFRIEIENFPHDTQAYAHLAIVYALTGRIDESRAALKQMVQLNPSRRTEELAARTLAELGDRSGAAQFGRK